ncbi:DUF6879 family protein [Catellatospora citrea]|uniref:DUF6879 domain-containing protein n=1 Tax=Catellatospora citrea TaxID=53366 RepID=A0A8J3KGL7_9ACTN|nr:DUF6879 family protein [Catellatospora citrea]RKE11313.1 hypothetical protein C8E86_6237 [Catellatospora citrea]GIF96780.1 hypothetical protein Cci01nite_18740 [Catellatospora citrea]
MAGTKFADLLGTCQRYAVHLEIRDGYMQDDPAYLEWQKGHRLDPTDRESWWRPWLANVENAVARGVVMRRARIISEPISDYIRWEHSETFTNVRAGEQIRWLPRHEALDVSVPLNDFWLFDDTILLFNLFGGNGGWVGQQRCDDPGIVKTCREAFEAVWERATPHEEYNPV